MKNITAGALIGGLFALFLAGSSLAGPLEDGKAAYDGRRYAEALQILQPLAEAGNIEAQNRMGLMYLFGEGAPKDLALAVRWFRMAADQGDARAQYQLGDIYAGIDPNQAVPWLTKAAEQGLNIAQVTLGADYENGWGVGQDYAQAAAWYRRSADQGNINAQLSLGMMLSEGRGVPKDPVAAYMWLSLAHKADPHDALVTGERDRVAAKLNGAQLARANRLQRDWRPGDGKN